MGGAWELHVPVGYCHITGNICFCCVYVCFVLHCLRQVSSRGQEEEKEVVYVFIGREVYLHVHVHVHIIILDGDIGAGGDGVL